MKYNIIAKYKDNNLEYYIVYENNKKIYLTKNNELNIFDDKKYIYLLKDRDIYKVFDINNKRFLTKSIEMKILYNNYKESIRKANLYDKKKILKQN